jgi:hypothetical protein
VPNSHDFEEIEILPPTTPKPEIQTVRVTTFAPDEKYRQKVKSVNKKPQSLHEYREKPLSEILTKLQKSNHLPETLRPEHVDNSVKTLVKILNNLKQKENVPKPQLELSNHAVDYENYDDGNHGFDRLHDKEMTSLYFRHDQRWQPRTKLRSTRHRLSSLP